MDVIRKLENLKQLLPGDTPNKVEGESCFECFDNFVFHDEAELERDTIVYLRDARSEESTQLGRQLYVEARRIAEYRTEVNKRGGYPGIVALTKRLIEDRWCRTD